MRERSQDYQKTGGTKSLFELFFVEKFLQMEIHKTYVRQVVYDGVAYTKGSVVDLYEAFHIACQQFPFKKNPEIKPLPTRDWAGSDGVDVYVPDVIPMKEYDMEVTFLYVRNIDDATGGQSVSGETPMERRDRLMRSDIRNFIDYICGRIGSGAQGDSIESGRLAIYDEYTGMGRKDVVVQKVDNELFFSNGDDPDVVAKFKVKFMVYDPTTDVYPESGTYSGVTRVTKLKWSGDGES